MLYPNCSEWTVRVKILSLDKLNKKELDFMEEFINDERGDFIGYNKGGYYGEFQEDDYYNIEYELEKLPFWGKIKVSDGVQES